MEKILDSLIKEKIISHSDKVLVVCGGLYDANLLLKNKLSNFLITSAYKKLNKVKKYMQADAQCLPFKGDSFDIVIVNAGLHHCASPHQALTEMYRVAKKIVIVHEAQDSVLIRLLVWLKFIFDYEMGAIDAKEGGFNNTALPNFVYRWNKREVKKILNSFDPSKKHFIKFYSRFHFYPFYLDEGEFLANNFLVKILGRKFAERIISIGVWFLNLIASDQGNDLIFLIRKDISEIQPWITTEKLKKLATNARIRKLL